MDYYFNTTVDKKKFRGAKKKICLPITLNNDLQKIQDQALKDHNYSRRLKLSNAEDLKALAEIAQDREEWRRLVVRVKRAGEAELSVDNSVNAI